MRKKETTEEKLLRLRDEYDFSSAAVEGVRGCRPKISVECGEKWFVRMENEERMPLFFRDCCGNFTNAVVSAETLEEALNKLEIFCAEQKQSGAILVDPESVENFGRNNKRVTLNDIAKKVGCSRAAVSFAILGNHPIGDELKMRIFAELERSNYHPAPAKKIQPRKSIVLLSRVHEGDMAGSHSAAFQVMKRGYNPILCYLPLNDPLNEEGQAAFAQLRQIPNVAGILSLHPTLESVDILRNSGELPVTINCRPDSMLSKIYYDFTEAGELVAALIRKYKHRKVAFVSYGEFGSREYQCLLKGLTSKSSKGKEIGIHDIPLPASCDLYQESFPLLDEAFKQDCTFFFVQGAVYCYLVERWAEKRGLSIPEDLSLLYIDYDKLPEHLRPSASALVVPNRDILKNVVDEMICKIEHSPLTPQVIHPCIIDRGTVAKVSSAGNK